MNADFLLESLRTHPCAEPTDAIKFLYQREFGCGHLLPDEATCARRIREEIAQTEASPAAPAAEPLGNGLCRLNLRCAAVRALPAERIARMMAVTQSRVHGSWERFLQAVEQLLTLAETGGAVNTPASRCLPFSAQALRAFLPLGVSPDQLPPRHSERYRAAYQPAYRVVLQPFAMALPVLSALEDRLAAGSCATLALDGDCASGKTTLAALLSSLYGATVIHMDDFFLPFAMRTQDRMAEPGGNIHYERFAREVLGPLAEGRPFSYGAFNCHTGASRDVFVEPGAVRIIEGSYALHPAFDGAYASMNGVRALLRVDPAEQLRRIALRNGPELLGRFRDEWIPLEIRYFQAYHRTREDELLLESPPTPEDE